MTVDQTLYVMALYNKLWKPAGLDGAGKVIGSHFTRHGSSGHFSGVPAFRRYVSHYLKAFPDLRFVVDDWLAQGEKVMIRYSFTGTHESSFMGVDGTGRKIKAEGVAIYRIVDGKLVELWDFLDLFGIAEQLGVQMQSVDPTLSWK
jgi:predicted ester cyclase